MSRLIDIVNSPWALQPEKLTELVAIYCSHVRGEKIDIAAIEARLGQPLNNEQQSYAIEDGVAIISVHGVLAKRMNMFSRISGGASTELIGRDLRAALEDTRVHSILLDVDSPGGAVDGTQALANQIYEGRSVKRIVALGDGFMTSGAYWVGSAASEVYIAADTVISGSIGVAMQHVDISRYEEKIGVKTTDIYSGKYKRIATEHAPLSDEGRATLQSMADQMYEVFVDSVARNRGVDAETVLKDMADGRLFVGRAAVDAGLVDGVATMDALIEALKSGGKPVLSKGKAAVSAVQPVQVQDAGAAPADLTTTQPKGTTMSITKQFIEANHAEIAEAFRAEGRATGLAEGASAERQRIKDVEAQALPGHATLINTLKFDGKTTGGEAAMQVNAAERAKLGKKTEDILADAAASAAPAVTASAAGPGADAAAAAAEAADKSKPVEDRCKAKWDADATVRSEFTSLEAYTAFVRAEEGGRIRRIGAKK